MAQDPKKRQKSLQRKAAKRKERRAGLKPLFNPSPRALFRQAVSWPLYEVWLTEDWDQEGTIIQIIVSRRSSSGQIAAGIFLIDLGCLGVKNAYSRVFDSRIEYQEICEHIMAHQEMMTADLNLVAKIIAEAVAYAQQLGFSPNPDYHETRRILGEAAPDVSAVHVPLGGADGKPYFIAGPHDNINKIITKLTKTVGPDGFHFMMPIGPETEVYDPADEAEFDDIDLDEED